MWSDDETPARRRVDQPGVEYPEDRRFHDWSDVEGARDEPPQPVQDAPRPALRLLPDPEPVEAASEPLAADPVAGIRAWAADLLAKYEAKRRYEETVRRMRE